MPRRRPSTSILLAIALGLALLLWLAFGDISSFRDDPPSAAESEAPPPPRVEVETHHAEPYAPTLVVQGHLEAYHELELRARLSGRVEALPVPQGGRVERGDELLRLEQDALPERLEQAEAELALARAELSGARGLRDRELISNPEFLRRQSAVSAAAAELADLRRQLDDTRTQAPFPGVLDRIDVDPGELLQVGETWGRLVDDSRLTAKAWVPQRKALSLEPGLPARIRLLDGSTLEGELDHVASRADEATRSFAIEVTLDNPEHRRLAGASATVELTLPSRRVHRLSSALLELDEQGQLAVKHLDRQDRVVRDTVELVSSNDQEARVTGLPEQIRLITLGGGFVDPGDVVTPVPADETETAADMERP
ncbi:efflux RND transporter periplasmic adaptor subunit [Halomonas elongata]|uniref:efflux RND transporter periplasmic adaptor subunit n=1 Tax=Halomonas elongata TaxID=2746 RepID=UPI002E2B1B08|nr:efflux RND transporter periplasmic adaptor subunit [Halomonas elongata]WVI72321.1 efflux RND transporter periplasmic adaptor subunit [Halomonas elongata]